MAKGLSIWQRARIAIFNTHDWGGWYRAFVRGEDSGQATGAPIDREMSLRYSAVFACVKVLSETLASLPIKLYRKEANGERHEANDLAIADILRHRPNEEMTPYNLKEALMMGLTLEGNAYAQKIVNRRGDLLGIYPIDSNKVTIERDDAGKLIYIIRNGETLTMTRKELFHIPGMSINGINGLTPIQYAAQAIRLGLTYEQFCVKFYENGANTSMALMHPLALKTETRDRLKAQIKQKVSGVENVNLPWLLEDGIQIKELTIHPVDAQLLESKMFQLEDICRIYRVPQHMINKLDRSTNNNIEHQSLEFVKYSMLPWFKRWEDNINMQLLTLDQLRAGYYVEFVVDALLRGDTKSRAESYAIGRQWGWYSVNDILRMENHNPIPNGDIYLQPSNMIEAGTTPPQPAPAPPQKGGE